MARRPKPCRIAGLPSFTHFKPRGIPAHAIGEIYLPLEGWEAIRLCDLENMTRKVAAHEMGVSRQTFGRILTRARKTVARAIIEGKGLAVQGGHFNLPPEDRVLPSSLEHAVIADSVSDLRNTGETVKIAVTSKGPGLDDPVDSRFGRAAGFLIVHPEDMSTVYIDNGVSNAREHGAGIAAAETVVRTGAAVLLTGYVGPKAYQALTAAGVAIGQDLDNMTVRQAIECYRNGQAKMAAAPNRPAHWQ